MTNPQSNQGTPALPSFQFDRYTLRPATWQDLPLAQTWTLEDPAHRDTTKPEFWIQQSMIVNSFVLEDSRGPVFFFKTYLKQAPFEEDGKWCEVHIQFTPGNALTQSRSRRGLLKGAEWLEKRLTDSGFEGYYFSSLNPQLIFFCQNRLSFEWDGTKIYKKIRR